MRICFDAGPLENQHRERGVGRCAQELLAAFSSEMLERHNAEVVYLKRSPVSRVAGPALGVDFAARSRLAAWTATNGRLPARLTERWKPLETAYLLPREIAHTGADVFLGTDPGAIAISPAFRTVAVVYDLIAIRYREEYLPRRAPITRAIWNAAVRRMRLADHLVAISEATRREAVDLLEVPSSRTSVVPLAVDPERFRPIAPVVAREHLRRRFGISGPFFLYVGGFDMRKNVPALLEAFSGLQGAEEPLLVIAGSLGNAGAALRHEFASRPAAARVRWLGYVADADLPYLYASALALTFPSLYEGFGLPLLEAMRCGTPVLTSSASSLPEVAGEAAIYVDPRSGAELRNAMRRLAIDPALRANLRRRGLSRAGQFSWSRSAERILEVCCAVAAGRPVQ